jgi:hypothetical protein
MLLPSRVLLSIPQRNRLFSPDRRVILVIEVPVTITITFGRDRDSTEPPPETRGPRNAGEGMRLRSLKAKYCKEYGRLRAERKGQYELFSGRLRRSGSKSLFIALLHRAGAAL